MKKYLILSLAVIGLTALASGLTRGNLLKPIPPEAASAEGVIEVGTQSSGTQYAEASLAGSPLYGALDSRAAGEWEVTPMSSGFTVAKEATQTKAPARLKKLTSAADLVGSYVQTSKTLVNTACRDAGNATKVSLGTAANTIVIERFWSNLYTDTYLQVTATVDVAESTVSIPSQVVLTHDYYGKISLVATNASGAPLRDQSIQGYVADDGTIAFTTWWGFFIDEGEHKDKYIYANYESTLRPANATLLFNTYSNSTVTYGYDIYVENNDDNTVTIYNIADAGMEITATLNGNRTISIPYETVMWYPYPVNNQNIFLSFGLVSDFAYDAENNSISNFQWGLTTDPAPANDNSTATFGNFAFLYTNGQGGGTTYGVNKEGQIRLKNGAAFNYPDNVDSNFEGSGTESDPYLIKTVKNLNALALNVNSAKAENNGLSISYTGIYFKLMADLDLSGKEFTPVGQDSYHAFNGHFDGNNHTITGLTMDRKSSMVYNGLFGYLGNQGSISNLTVKDAKVSGNYYTGAVAGYASGTIANCHAINPEVSNTSSLTGGIVGVAFGNISDCTVTGGYIAGLGGYAGGIVGEIAGHVEGADNHTVYPEITRCSATDTYIEAWTPADVSRAGGVAGTVYYANISDCYFSGVIDCIEEYNFSVANLIAGGVAGNVYGGDIRRCFATGNFLVGTYQSEVGGVVGALGGNMEDCYSAAKVYGANTIYAGGLTGEVMPRPVDMATQAYIKSTIKNSYSSSQVVNYFAGVDRNMQLPELIGCVKPNGQTNMAYTEYVVITNSYFNSDICNFGSSACKSNTATLTSAEGIAGLSTDTWTFQENAFPRLTASAQTEAAFLSASAILFPKGSNSMGLRANAPLNALGKTEFMIANGNQLGTTGTYASIKNKELVIAAANGEETIVFSNGSVQIPYDIQIMGAGLEGEGTEEDPMLIKTKEDLKTLADLVTADNTFQGKYVKMVNDIDMNFDPDFIGIAVSRNSSSRWYFGGIFDGGGHTIHNMRLNGVVWQNGKSPADDPDGFGTPNTTAGTGSIMYQAFIGNLDVNGVLKNINFAADCTDERGNNYGAVAVADNKGTVENVRNYADLKSYGGNAGGIVANNQVTGKIINCFNAGNILCGKNFAGGIAAQSAGVIENCANTGDIATLVLSRGQFTPNPTAKTFNNVGGIVGSLSGTSTKNVLNTGHTAALTNNVGGIAGQWSAKADAVSGAVAYGTMQTRDVITMGGIAGAYGNGQGIILNETSIGVYYDSQIVASGAVGAAKNEFVPGVGTSRFVSGSALAGLDPEVWDFSEGMYPVLKTFADEPTLQTARKIVVKMPEGKNAFNLTGTTSELAAVDGIRWSLKQNKVFRIDGSSLVAPASVDVEVNDTLVGSLNGYVKTIAISAKPANPLKGEGTPDNPYLISTAEEWNAYGSWLQMMMMSTEGVNVAVTADIDFGGAPMGYICTVEDYPWGGVLDGRGHTLSNYTTVTENSYDTPFRVVSSTGVIKNLTLDGNIDAQSGGYQSALVGKLYGKLENITNKTPIVAPKNLNFLASMAVYAYDGASLTNCVNYGNISSGGNTLGGLLAQVDGTGTVSVIDCANHGDVTITNSADTKGTIGGIAAVSKPASYVRCVNTGDLTGAVKSPQIGGIVGNATNVSGKTIYFTDCSNSGVVTGQAKLGGILGGNAIALGSVENCSNSGEIKSIATAKASNAGVAGICGVYGGAWEILNCVNTGNVTNTVSDFTGGIAGNPNPASSASSHGMILNCINRGEVKSAGQKAAGIVAQIGTSAEVLDCVNYAPVSTTAYCAAGICSYTLGANSKITNCANYGDIMGICQLGGIMGWSTQASFMIDQCLNAGAIMATGKGVGTGIANGCAVGGIMGKESGQISNSYNLGDVSGSNLVGGIVGQSKKGTSATAFSNKITNCYNAGAVALTEENDAALIGYVVGGNTNWNPSFNVATNVYYASDRSDIDSEGLGTGVTMAQLASADKAEIALGEGYVFNPYCLPVLTEASPEATLASICVFQEVQETECWISPDATVDGDKPFHIGHPAVVEFTTEAPIKIDGNDVTFTSPYDGEVVITAAAGEARRAIVFKAKATSGVTGIDVDAEAIDVKWYSPDGKMVDKPSTGVYIKVSKYPDGRTVSEKVVL